MKKPALKRRNRKYTTQFNGYNNIRSIKYQREARDCYISLDFRYLLKKNRIKMRKRLPTCPAMVQPNLCGVSLPFMMYRRRNVKFIELVLSDFRHRVKLKWVMFMRLRKRQLPFGSNRPYKVFVRPRLL